MMFERQHSPGDKPDIFFGSFGLRAAWSIAFGLSMCLLLMMVLPQISLSLTGTMRQAIAQSEALERARTTGQPLTTEAGVVAADEAGLLAAVAISTFAMSRIERRRLAWYGLGRGRFLDVFAGAFWGFAALSLLVFVLYRAHLLAFDGRLLQGPAMYGDGAKWLLTFLLVGFYEEYSTRGFLQYTLMRGLYGLVPWIAPAYARAAAFWMAAVVMSVVFGWLHLGNPGETWCGILMVFVAGLLFSYALWRTGSLWWAIGFHMAWDWAQSFLYGVPDSGGLSAGRLFLTHPTGNALLSGGADGPEGSVLVLPTLLLVALVIRFTTRPGVQPPLEQEHGASV